MSELVSWKNSPNRMPLVIDGARQVGKTWLMREFGKLHYKNTVYINLDDERKLHKIFEPDLNPQRLIKGLAFEKEQEITPADTLIIFDEIQECNRALMSLKYFCENAPEYHIVSAGSLLGVAIHKESSYPVGKVQTISLHPLNFAEFMDAIGEPRYKKLLENKDYNLSYTIEERLIDALKHYYFVGGMPKAVLAFAERSNLNDVRRIQEDILRNFELDFSKHIDAPSIPKVGLLWESTPNQLAKENKQFVYRDMKQGARASQYESAFYWLDKVGLIHKVHRVETPNLPLSAYKKEAFKVYLLDVGLLSAKVKLTIDNLKGGGTSVFSHFKGALTEQYVLQELKASERTIDICYWTNDRSKGIAEVDFLIQHNGEIIPIEVKSSINLKAKSLRVYMDYYSPRVAIRTSLGRYGYHDSLCDIPLYLIGQFAKICLPS
ncbi:ATP-binding protein [Deferribacterales bacterium RsTz2092]